MSAIYQRARPINWEQVVGQEQVKDVLRGALEQGRVGHAYLFSGPRGVGKTTTARLIAMTANCQSAGKKPCGECESCLAVRAGTHPDVLEIDAASNNSVEDVRDLREKVGLAAMRGGKKIYILDEAHMMSRAAFNALLKTLEEPPEHVIFILATTEPEKILPTIMSRCQHYRFRRLTDEEIAGKLQLLAQQEGVQADSDALHLIGRLADGAMRDGESLLERMLTSGEAITRERVEAALGLPPSEQLRGMATALVQADAARVLAGAAELYRAGYAARTVVEGLVSVLGEGLHAELGLGEHPRLDGADIPSLLKLQAALDEQSSRFARAADQQSLELALTHALMALQTGTALPAVSSPTATAAPDQALLGRISKLERELSRLAGGGTGPLPSTPQTAPNRSESGRSESGRPESSRPTAIPRSAAPAPAAPTGGNWADVLQRANMQMRAFLKPARMHAEAGYVSLSYDAKGKFHAKQVYDKFDTVGGLVLQVFGAVTFELISPDHNRKQVLGTPSGSVALPEAAPVTAQQQPAAAPAPNPAPADLTDFEPTRRSAPRPSPPPLDDLPPFEPTRRGAGPSQAAAKPSSNPATAGKVMPPSPDDMAAAPLPETQPSAQQHAADTPPQPEQSGPPPASQEPELYVPAEPLAQEPVWDDLPPFEPAPRAGPTPPAAPRSAPAAPRDNVNPAAPASAAGISGPGAAIRNHPNYQEVTRLFSGRIKEIGTVKARKQAETEQEVHEEEAEEA